MSQTVVQSDIASCPTYVKLSNFNPLTPSGATWVQL